jgi:hypothetical protein
VEDRVALLDERAPRLRKAVRDPADRPFYSGKRTKHGMNLQVIGRLQLREA